MPHDTADVVACNMIAAVCVIKLSAAASTSLLDTATKDARAAVCIKLRLRQDKLCIIWNTAMQASRCQT